MAASGAFFDANVLYPAGLRNFLMHLALTGLFPAHWSAEVQEEWTRNVLRLRSDLNRETGTTRYLMDKALPDAMVTGYEYLIDSLKLPDPDDRHVFAAAIHCGASVIVTLNLSDFPKQSLARLNIEAQHPDDFVSALLESDPAHVFEAARNHRSSLKNPPKTPHEYLAELDSQSLRNTADLLRLLVRDGAFVI